MEPELGMFPAVGSGYELEGVTSRIILGTGKR